jgi:fructokinase
MILVCGEALMDVFAKGDTATGMALDARVGGSPFNVAVGLARLGQPVSFVGTLSQDFLGQRLLRSLESEGVVIDAVSRVNAPTTLSLVGMDAAGVPPYAFYGSGGADRQLTLDALGRLPTAMAVLHIGSFATVVEPVATTLRAMVERCQGRTLISYDPNVRLGVEPDVARWRAMLQWMLPRTQLLKISEEDLSLLMPGCDPQQFLDEALAQGVGAAVVTRGPAGALARTASATVSVSAVSVQLVDTVGAGDTFQAGLLTWLAENQCLRIEDLAALDMRRLTAAVEFAVRAAAITCTRRGADMPRRAELT